MRDFVLIITLQVIQHTLLKWGTYLNGEMSRQVNITWYILKYIFIILVTVRRKVRIFKTLFIIGIIVMWTQ
jgi:hypothetical protein